MYICFIRAQISMKSPDKKISLLEILSKGLTIKLIESETKAIRGISRVNCLEETTIAGNVNARNAAKIPNLDETRFFPILYTEYNKIIRKN